MAARLAVYIHEEFDVSKERKPRPPVPMTADEDRQALTYDISLHVGHYGYKDWPRLFAKYPNVSQRTIWRAITRYKSNDVTQQEQLASAIKKSKKAALAAQGVIPVAPPPQIIAKMTPKGSASIDFMAQFRELLGDIDLLRSWSMTEKDGVKSIKNAMYFSQAIKLRLHALETGLHAYQEFWDLRKMEDFYNTILETIAEVDPNVRDEIMKRLDSLNNERGFTVNARIGEG